jgi:hypothetical protein
MLLTARLNEHIDRKGATQHQFALFGTLPRGPGAPAREDFTQIPDRDIDGCRKVDLVDGAIVIAIVAQPQYFCAHASPRESLVRNHGGQPLMSRNRADY